MHSQLHPLVRGCTCPRADAARIMLRWTRHLLPFSLHTARVHNASFLARVIHMISS